MDGNEGGIVGLLACARRIVLRLLAIGTLLQVVQGCAVDSSPGTTSPLSVHQARPEPQLTPVSKQPVLAQVGGRHSKLEPLPAVAPPPPDSALVKQVSWETVESAQEELPPPATRDALDVAGDTVENQFPIDLPATLRLAGANNLQIALAAARVGAARARLQGAHALWLPSFNGGIGYNLHRGKIQDTAGDILDINRSSVFVGGGPVLGGAPLNGGTNGPARLFVGLPLTDAIFAPLAERQLAQAAGATQAATFNDALLAASAGYLELVRAVGQVAIAREAVANSKELVRLVAARVRAGTAPPADELRAQAELADRHRKVFVAEEAVRDASADLVRVLNLPPELSLLPNEEQPLPIELVDTREPLPKLLAVGIASRPELAAHRAFVQATLDRLRQEEWRPAIPNLQVGFSAGGFGGGVDDFFGDFAGRTDFDALAVWELRGLGFGNVALVRERRSQFQQARITREEVRNTIAAEIVRSYYQIRLRESQIESARRQVQAAGDALPLNFKGILGGQLRAIEALQAIDALTAAQTQYLTSIIDYDRAQFALLRALGNPPDPQTNPQPENLGALP
ncbi:MAG: TolC family protein [Pirellulales bacterium]